MVAAGADRRARPAAEHAGSAPKVVPIPPRPSKAAPPPRTSARGDAERRIPFENTGTFGSF